MWIEPRAEEGKHAPLPWRVVRAGENGAGAACSTRRSVARREASIQGRREHRHGETSTAGHR
jgi:hypothetical protein